MIEEVAINSRVARVVIRGVRHQPGVGAEIFGLLADAGVEVLGISYDAAPQGRGDVAFVVFGTQVPDVLALEERLLAATWGSGVSVDQEAALLSFKMEETGSGGVAYALTLLASAGANVETLSYLPGVLWVVINGRVLDRVREVLLDHDIPFREGL